MMNGRVATMVVMLGMLVQGCGYQFSVEGPGPRIGGGPSLMDDAGPVVWLTIRNFRNRTFHRNLEYACTRSMRQEFAVSSGARVVSDDEQADYVMEGEIVSVVVSSLTFSTNETRERRVEVVVSARVKHRRTGDVAWTGTATGIGEFFVNRAPDVGNRQDEIQFNQVLRERALEHAGQDVAEILAASFRDAWRQGHFSPGPSSSVVAPRGLASSPVPVPSTATHMPLLACLPESVR